MQQVILDKLEIAIVSCSSINIVRAISREVVVKIGLEILRPDHWKSLIVDHILLLLILLQWLVGLLMRSLEGIEITCPINWYFSWKSIVGKSVKDHILNWREKPRVYLFIGRLHSFLILPPTIWSHLRIQREFFNTQINEAVFSLQGRRILPNSTVLPLELLHRNLRR